ncbi:MAG: hypothetical protein ABWZ40_15100 [Caulobacterales bacterium]
MFANLKACVRSVVVVSVASAALAGCASGSNVQRAEVAREDLHATAQQFAAIAEARGWSQKGQGAVSTLLSGRASEKVTTPAEAYLNAKGEQDMPSLAQAVMVDLGAAADQTQNLAVVAEACASHGVDPINARANLSSLERALIIAKRARMVLASAVDRVRAGFTPGEARKAQESLASLETQIGRLDTAADKLAEQRGV